MYQESRLQMDEISVRLIGRELRRNFIVLLLTALTVMFGLGIDHNLFYVPEYTSMATLSVQAKGTTNVNAYSSLATSSKMAVVYQDVFLSQVLRSAVQEKIGSMSAETSISTKVMNGTNLLLLYVTAKNPEAAYTVIKEMLAEHHVISDYMFSNAVVEVVASPEVPTKPVNRIEMWKMAAFGGGMGFLFAAALLVVYSVFRSTVKTARGAQRNVEGGQLGIISHEVKNRKIKDKIKRKNKGLLITNSLPGFSFKQEYSQLALHIGYQMRMQQAKLLLVTSILENEGKTTVTANLAIALAKVNPGKKVLVLDLDFKRPAMYKLFGKKARQNCLKAYLESKIELEDILNYDKKNGVYQIFIYGNIAASRKILGGARIQMLLEAVRAEMDFIIVDSAPFSAGTDVQLLSGYTDASLVVIRQDCARIADINDGIEQLSDAQGKYLGYILNDFDKQGRRRTDDEKNKGTGLLRGRKQQD